VRRGKDKLESVLRSGTKSQLILDVAANLAKLKGAFAHVYA
jgi:hypothetical protein